jgi:hypothetical protein
MRSKQKIKWMGKNSKPKRAGWYYTKTTAPKYVVCRYYDDTDDSWSVAVGTDGFVPNNSFSQWLWVEEIHS